MRAHIAIPKGWRKLKRGEKIIAKKDYHLAQEPWGEMLWKRWNINAIASRGTISIRKEKTISKLERSKGRSENYYQMTMEAQWEEDKILGLLDWDGK